MRKIGDLFKELGFNKDAPIETQKAFVRHLINKANLSEPQPKPAPVTESSTQLSFDPQILGLHAK